MDPKTYVVLQDTSTPLALGIMGNDSVVCTTEFGSDGAPNWSAADPIRSLQVRPDVQAHAGGSDRKDIQHTTEDFVTATLKSLAALHEAFYAGIR